MTIPEYINVLRTTKYKQIPWVYIKGNDCCAYGVGVKTLCPTATDYVDATDEAMAEMNLLDRQLHTIGVSVRFLNDKGYEGKEHLDFLQIADIVEEAYACHELHSV